MLFTRCSISLSLVFVACAGTQKKPVTPLKVTEPMTVQGKNEEHTLPTEKRGSSDVLDKREIERRKEGLSALDNGEFLKAESIFVSLLESHPANVGLRSLFDGAREAKVRARNSANTNLDNSSVFVLKAPPFTYTMNKEASLLKQASKPKILKISEKKNSITDTSQWLTDNTLTTPEFQLANSFTKTNGTLPLNIATEFAGKKISSSSLHGDHIVTIYDDGYAGRFLVITATDGTHIGIFDFLNWARGPKEKKGDEAFVKQGVRWGEVQNGILYTATGHSTYAESSSGHNAYISAIEIKTGDLLWQSEALVANSANFLLRDGWVITGYGFTSEPDFLFVLDMKTGKKVQKIKLKSGPTYIIERENRLYVRTYNRNYVFTIE